MLRHYPLKTLPDYRREGYRSLVNKAVYASLFRGENDGEGLHTGGNGGMSEGEGGQPGEDPCQMVCSAFNQIVIDTWGCITVYVVLKWF